MAPRSELRRERRPERRSAQALAYRHLYRTARWLALRAAVLSAEPLCRMCGVIGRTRAASVVDHIVPHRGDEALFYDRANCQALCADHHNQTKQREERVGYSDALDAFGWPTDGRHPSNRRPSPR